jgi:small subunit ribosomal protein S6
MIMPVALYESLFAFDSTKMSSEGDAIKAALHNNLEKYGAEIVIARPWDEKFSLAYPIKKQKKAYFYIVYYKMESTKQRELETDLRINEFLLRHMTSAVDPKWAESILDSAKPESGPRFAVRSMQDDSAALGEGIVSNDPLVRGENFDASAAGAGAGGPPRGPRARRERTDDKPE